MKNKNLKKIFTTFLVAVFITGVYFLGFFTYKWTRSDTEKDFLKILDAYDKYYYSDGKIVDKIMDALFDEYSRYYTPEEYEALKRANKGENVGVGLSFISISILKRR